MRQALTLLALVACGDAPRETAARSEAADDPPPRTLTVEDLPPATARTLVLEALSKGAGPVSLVGAGAWQTRVRPGPDATRTFVRRSFGPNESLLELAFRVGAGDRGAYMGGAAGTSAIRAMGELRVSDPGIVGARFVIRLFASGARGRLVDVTPRHLRRPLGRGVYRAWVDIAPAGGKVLAHVDVRQRGERVAEGYASPVAVERPWLE